MTKKKDPKDLKKQPPKPILEPLPAIVPERGTMDIKPLLVFLKRSAKDKLKEELELLEDALDIAIPDDEKASERVLKPISRELLPKIITYLETLRATGNKSRACSEAHITFSATKYWRSQYPQFKVAELIAKEMSTDDLVEEGRRRAFEGVVKPSGWYQGRPGAYVREYSDNLLMFLIKANRPEYRDSYQEGSSGGVVVQVTQYGSKPDDTVIDVTPKDYSDDPAPTTTGLLPVSTKPVESG